jgi:hypothetical protein
MARPDFHRDMVLRSVREALSRANRDVSKTSVARTGWKPVLRLELQVRENFSAPAGGVFSRFLDNPTIAMNIPSG